jgi:hypothetical protein
MSLPQYVSSMPPDSSHLGSQLVWLFVLAIPVACMAWTVTHEEVFREPREFCEQNCKSRTSIWQRKFFYLFTCEYCFSHYVTAFFLFFTHFKLLLDDWRGYVLALFAVVWVANAYMNLFARVRVDLRYVRAEAEVKNKQVQKMDLELTRMNGDQ